jgi:hypothetical protein
MKLGHKLFVKLLFGVEESYDNSLNNRVVEVKRISLINVIHKHERRLPGHLLTPGDQTFFLKKNEKFLSWKNLIKMNYFIHIFFLQKMRYFTEKKMCEK